MTGHRDAKKQNMLITLVLWCVICSVSMAVMLITASGKTIVIADVAQERTEASRDAAQEMISGKELILTEDKSMERQLYIPLENGIKAENIVVENRYMDRELWVYIQRSADSFYDTNAIVGDVSWIEEGLYSAQENGIVLKLQMSEVMEYQSTLENGRLKLAFCKPGEQYEQIVVIDPVGGGSETGITADDCYEKDLTGQVAKLLQKKITDPNIKVYFTRTEDVEVPAEKRLQLIKAVEPDIYLRLGVSENTKDAGAYGIQSYYNGEYYIPGFGNIQWADLVTRKVTIASSNLAIGLLPAEEHHFLRQLEIPAAQINLGFLTNEQERQLLQQESYQDKLAQGIADAILEVYTNNEGK